MDKPRKYRCVKEFCVNLCDDDGCLIDNAPPITIPVGWEYEVWTPGLNLDVWCTSKEYGWLDLDMGTFNECFEEVCE